MTTVREFRTIKNCEFFHTGPIIFDPTIALESKGTLCDSDKLKMQGFIEKNVDKFNKSQLEALDRVAVLKEKDILLIQGPVSISTFLLTFFSLELERLTLSTV
jgi:hypothetical protein